MAQELTTSESREMSNILNEALDDFVTFTIDGQLFGIPVLKVQDILILREIAPIPLAPPAIIGSINLRGRIVTVVGVRTRLGLPELDNEGKAADYGVTIERGHDLYTLLADSIGDVVSTSSETFEGNPNTLDSVWREYALGVHRLEGRLMVILDVDRLLDISGK